MANPYQAFVGTYVGGAGVAQSGFVTFSFANTAGFEAYIPLTMTCPGTTTISAGAEVTIYRTADGGTTWETEGSLGAIFPRPINANEVRRRLLYLGIGQFLIAVQVGGGSASTWTAQVGTAYIITAYA